MSPAAQTAAAPLNAERTLRSSRRTTFILWLRKTHGWIGLWGATLGLLFGSSGVLLNHRAQLKLPLAQQQESTAQLELPEGVPSDAKALAIWLQQELKLDRPATRIREEGERAVAWGDQSLQQPAHWNITFATPRMNIQADWWAGNRFVTVKRSDSNVFATLANLHRGNGMSVSWILLVDTLAGSIVLLSLTGVILWTQLNRKRVVGASIATVSLVITLLLALRAM